MILAEHNTEWQQILSILELRVSKPVLDSVFALADATLTEPNTLTVTAPSTALDWMQGRWYNHLATAASDVLGDGIEITYKLKPQSAAANGHAAVDPVQVAESIPLDVFQGFLPPTENWSKLPHEFIDALPLVETRGEMKVILYVLRHTWGYQDDEKKITLDEFEHGRKRRKGTRIDNGTGLTRVTIINGIKRAVKHGFLIVETDKSDRARTKKYYSLKGV